MSIRFSTDNLKPVFLSEPFLGKGLRPQALVFSGFFLAERTAVLTPSGPFSSPTATALPKQVLPK